MAEFVGMGAGVVGIGAAIGGALAELAISGGEVIERFFLIGQKTGIAVRDLQSFEAAGLTVGVSLEDMVTAMRKFDQAITGSSKNSALAKVVLHDLGVTSRDPKEAILQVAEAFSHMEDGAVKGAMAVALFGRSGLTMIPELNKGREGFAEAAASVDKYGQALTGGAIAANEKWKDSTRDLTVAWEGFRIKIAESVLPTLAQIIDKIAAGIKATGDWIAQLNQVPAKAQPYNMPWWMRPSPSQNSFYDWDQYQTPAGPKAPAPPANWDAGANARKTAAENAFDMLKAGGPAEFALEQAKATIEGKRFDGKYAEASLLQKQLPQKEAEAKIEKEITAEVERRLVAKLHILQIEKLQGAGGTLGPQFKPDFFEHRDFEAGQPAPDVFHTADQLGAINDSIQGTITGKMVHSLPEGQGALAAFYDKWKQENKKATDVIVADYQTQLTEFEGFLALGAIDQKQFDDVRVKLAEEATKKILKARDEEMKTWDEEALKWGSYQDKLHALLNEVALDGQNMGAKIFESFHKAIDDLSSQLATFVVTGKANFKQLFTSLEESIAKAGFQSIFGHLASGIGAKLGLPTLGGKRDGSSAAAALYVTMDGGLGGLGGIFGKGRSSNDPLEGGGIPFSGHGTVFGDGGGADPFSGITDTISKITSGLMSVLSKVASSIGSVFSSIFGMVGGIFGGGLAGGGDMVPGHSYLVGEKHPEILTVGQPAHVSPSASLEMGNHTTINMHVHGVQDADSFRRSSGQIMGDLARQLSIAHGRNF
jgi:hypothetical protein